MDDLYGTLLAKLPSHLTELTEDPQLRKFLVATPGGTFPHKELPGFIRAIYGSRRTAGSIGVALPKTSEKSSFSPAAAITDQSVI